MAVSPEHLPAEGHGDFFEALRFNFRRVHDGGESALLPVVGGAVAEVGDRLDLRTRHAAEYVRLWGAGFELESLTSRFSWHLALGYYEEVRDSGTNFCFEWLPAGEYTFKYRLRANNSGTFRVGAATQWSMYGPNSAPIRPGVHCGSILRKSGPLSLGGLGRRLDSRATASAVDTTSSHFQLKVFSRGSRRPLTTPSSRFGSFLYL